jgi:hypothetical protein
MSPEYLVLNCQFRDSTSDYYDQLINLAEDYLDKTDEPTVTGFNNYIIHNINYKHYASNDLLWRRTYSYLA